MGKTNRKRLNTALVLLVVFTAVADFVLLLRYFLQGTNIALLNPKGFVAQQQLKLMVFSVILLLSIALPTLAILYFTAWKYRESNEKTKRNEISNTSKSLVASMWLVPSIFMLVLASVMWPSTHKLVPQKVIASSSEPLTIQVISMNWKWLFLYPDQNIATVNFVQIPVDRPVTFELTADESPMSSFWIPNLGGQLYSMTTHVNRLNLLAEVPGDYPGNSAEINGKGFAGMKFTARVSSELDFENWLQEVQESTEVLELDEYNELLKPSEKHPVTYYSAFKNNLFSYVVEKYNTGSHGAH